MGKPADAALALAEAFFRSMPADRKKRMSEAEWTVSLNSFQREAMEIRNRYGLGLLARARAAYLFQKRLMDAGFRPDTVRKVVFSLILSSFTGE